MSLDLAQLRMELQSEIASGRGCMNAMAEAGAPYPCSANCPCALRDAILSDAARIAAADALVATLLDFPTVHLERVYDLAEAYRATAPASPTTAGDEI